MDMDIIKRFIYGAKEAYKKVDNHSFNFPFTIDSAYRLATNIEKLLKEQEAIKPYIDIDEAKCPICKVKLTRQELLGDDVLFEDFFDYCPHCGRAVKWDA